MSKENIHQNFNPNIHELSSDGKSWWPKEAKNITYEIATEYKKLVEFLSSELDISQQEAVNQTEKMITIGEAKNFEEAKEIITKGPIIEGFESSKDIKISNQRVKEFVFETFGEKAIRKAKISRIIKNNRYLIIFKSPFASDFSDKDREYYQKVKSLLESGLLQIFAANIAMAKNKEDYLQAEAFLENKEDISNLEHIYRVRASTGDFKRFSTIRLESFDVESSGQFDYLNEVGLETEEDKMKAYMLGTIAHEIAHRLQKINPDLMDKYQEIVKSEKSSLRKKYVTDYVLKHEIFFNSNEETLTNEDFAEAVRIYTINEKYLTENYPRRTDFLKKYFPFIVPNKAVQVIKRKND